MAIQEVIISSLQAYIPILAFLSGLILGDALILLAMLSGAGKVSFWTIFIFGLIGELTHDIVFYFISNSKLAFYIKKKLKLSKKRSKIAEYIEKFGGGKSYFLPLVIAKFIYGVRDAVVIYVSHNEKKFKRYLITVIPAGLIWVTTITSAGWLAGKGFVEVLYVLKGVEKGLVILLFGLIALYLINRFIILTIWRYVKKNNLSLIKNKLWNSNYRR
ncbi:MAG: hypothetical protein AABW75_04825 [Nanoarchaeota archaeon]